LITNGKKVLSLTKDYLKGKTKEILQTPLLVSETLLPFGFHPINISTQKQKFSHVDHKILNFDAESCESLIPYEVFSKEQIEGGWNTTKHDVVGIAQPRSNQLDFQLIEKALKFNNFGLQIPNMVYYPCKEDLRIEGFNRDASSGFMSSLLLGKIKRKSFDLSLKIAEILFQKVGSKFKADTSLWKIGARNRLQNRSEEYKEIRSRAVFEQEFCVSMISQI